MLGASCRLGRGRDMQHEPGARRGSYIPVASGAAAGAAFGLILGGLIGGVLGWSFLPQIGCGVGAALGGVAGYRISRLAAGGSGEPTSTP